MSEADRVPRLARPFVAVLLAAMVASAVFVWEPWPLTSFRLFSHLRAENQTSWEATTIAADGSELPFRLGALPRGHRGFIFTMAEFERADPGRRAEICRAWFAAAKDLLGRDAVEIRLYRRHRPLSERRGDRSLPGQREAIFACSPRGARVAE